MPLGSICTNALGTGAATAGRPPPPPRCGCCAWAAIPPPTSIEPPVNADTRRKKRRFISVDFVELDIEGLLSLPVYWFETGAFELLAVVRGAAVVCCLRIISPARR